MADQKQLDLLRQGVDTWNAWRTQHKEARPDLSRADLSGTHLSGADLSRTDLSGAILSDSDLLGATLSRATLTGAILSNASLIGTHFDHADLSGAILSDVNLLGADFNYANLSGAHLSDANLDHAIFSNANLSGAHLNYANLSGAILNRADLSKAAIGRTIFGDLDLRTVKGLETVIHKGPSTIGTDTISRSEGDIPEVFLRGAGLSDAFITYARSLAQNPIEYYTCFISYSSKDQEFAERLHSDLQAKGVRCWFAPEDLKIGEKVWHRIDESIRLYDKLLVVLSEHSVNSVWVEHEVMSAFEKEQQHIGDFINWRQHNDYQKALARLLRDLQPETPPQK